MSTIAVPSPQPAGRLRGTLLRIHQNGYGFIHVGPGLPEYWIQKRQVPAAEWRTGRALTFLPGQPKKPGTAPAALDVLPDEVLPLRPPPNPRRKSGEVDEA